MDRRSRLGGERATFAWRWGAWRCAAAVLAVTVGAAGLPAALARPAAADGTTTSVVGDPGWVPNVDAQIGVTGLWRQGVTGAGVGVALIDTGVAPVPGLTSGNLVVGPDLSTTAGSGGMAGADAYGHGTFMGSIIAGRDNGITAGAEANLGLGSTSFVGVAPDATLVDVAVGAGDGAVDPSQVIAALDWVAAHHADPGVNIRVVNLSYGSNSTQSYVSDPVAAAVERVWKAGVVVDVAAGNEGQQNAMLTDPATDPYVIAVGANGAYSANGQKLFVTSFTNSGNLSRHVDVVAPGSSIVALRDPGSYVDVFHTEGMVPVDTTGRYFRGSGTSEATAVTSGVVALLLQQYPSLTPDQVKNVLMASATPLYGTTANMVGAGSLNASAAFALAGQLVRNGGQVPSGPTGGALANLPDHGGPQTWAPSTGSGSLEASRGGVHIPVNGSPLTGEDTVFGTAYDPTLAGSPSAPSNLASWGGGGTWDSNRWSGRAWNSNRWSGQAWAGDAWTSNRWSGQSWSSNRWSSGSWDSNRWSGALWDSTNWSSVAWSGNNWGQPASQVQFSAPSGVAVDAAGNVWVANTGNNQVDKFSPSGVQLTIVAATGNGSGQNGRLNGPGGVATDATGNVYVADTRNNQVEEFTATGTFVRVFTANGLAGHDANTGQLKSPSGVAVDAAGDVYVADTGDNQVVELSPNGVFIRALTTSGLTGPQALMHAPQGVAVDPAGNLYVADTANNQVEMFNTAGTLVGTWRSNANPALQNAAMNGPADVAVDGAGSVWVADTANNQVERIVTATGAETYWTTVGSGTLSGPAAVAVDAAGNVYIANGGTSQIEVANPTGVLMSTMGMSSNPTSNLNSPSGVAIDAAGSRYIADAGNNRIVKSSGTGVYLTAVAGDGLPNGTLSKPGDVAVSPSGNLWVADTGNNRVEEFTPNGTFLLAITANGMNPATVQSTTLSAPAAVTTDAAGNVYVADTRNNRVEKYSPSGTFLLAFTSNGMPSGQNTQLSSPSGVAVDAAGDVYIADTANNRVAEFGPAGAFITAWDNSGTPARATMSAPTGITLDTTGNLWVADTGNNQLDEINLATAAVTGWTNNASGTGQGTMSKPLGLAVDAAGNVFVADTGNSQIDQFNDNAVVLSTIGANAALSTPAGAAVDANGNIYVADSRNNRVAKYGPGGTFITSFNLDGTGAGQNAQMSAPSGVAVDPAGNVYIADTGNNQVEELTGLGVFVRAFTASGLTNNGTPGQLSKPSGVAVDPAGNVYIADTGNNRVEKYSNTGSLVGAFTASGLTAAGGTPGQLAKPSGVTVDATGNIYITDTGDNQIVGQTGTRLAPSAN